MASTVVYGVALVFAQFALRHAPPWRGAAISVPSATLMFWCLAPFLLDVGRFDPSSAMIFAAVGVLFPASVTILSMESNRRMGPNVAAAIGNLTPLVAVFSAIAFLGEAIGPWQAVGIGIIVAGVMLLSSDRKLSARRWPLWVLVFPLAAVVVRGVAPPVVKHGLAAWPDPFAATLIGYTMSALVLTGLARVRSGGVLPPVSLPGRAWFAFVGILNGLSVLLMYGALAYGPVALVAPLFAAYPLVTLLASRLLLRQEALNHRLTIGVAATVVGVVLLIAGQARP